MKFYPKPILRFCYRYIAIVLFLLFPLIVTFYMPFDEIAVRPEDRFEFMLFGAILFIASALMFNFAFLEKFFATLTVHQQKIVWRCPFRKTKVILLNKCAEVGVCVANKSNGGIPVEQIYFCDHTIKDVRAYIESGKAKCSDHLILYWYDERLSDYVLKHFPSKITKNLSAYRWQKK